MGSYSCGVFYLYINNKHYYINFKNNKHGYDGASIFVLESNSRCFTFSVVLYTCKVV